MKSQNDLILKHLKSGRSITRLEADRKFNCLELPQRIHDLKAKGYDIGGKMIALPSGKKVKRYVLV